MKRSKLLFVAPILITPCIFSSVSCSSKAISADDVVNAVFNYCETPTTPPEECNDIVDALLKTGIKEQQTELIYYVFAPTIYNPLPGETDMSINSIWKANKLNFGMNITKCILDIDASSKDTFGYFFGSLIFVFNDDFSNFQKDDAIQIALGIDKLPLKPNGNQWSLRNYPPLPEPACYGIMEVIQNSHRQRFYINSVGPSNTSGIPQNWHNWSK